MVPIFPAQQTKVVFLVGAGASKGAGGLNQVPPLGTELYVALRSFSPLWENLPASIAEKFASSSFEDAFGRWTDGTAERFKSHLLWHAAWFFDSFRIVAPERCAYVSLARHYLGLGILENVVFASLNYDTLFEQAFIAMGVRVRGWGSENGVPKAWFVKPHGSANYLPDQSVEVVVGELTGNVQIHSASYAYAQPSHVACSSPTPLKMSQSLLHPVMAHYNKEKTLRAGGDLIETSRKEWDELARRARLAVIIGVMPTESDEVIWKPLRESSAKILFVNPSVADCQKVAQLRTNVETAQLGFSEALGLIQRAVYQACFAE
jgi:hypothetical protein